MNKYASNRLICDYFTLFQELKNYFKIKIQFLKDEKSRTRARFFRPADY